VQGCHTYIGPRNTKPAGEAKSNTRGSSRISKFVPLRSASVRNNLQRGAGCGENLEFLGALTHVTYDLGSLMPIRNSPQGCGYFSLSRKEFTETTALRLQKVSLSTCLYPEWHESMSAPQMPKNMLYVNTPDATKYVLCFEGHPAILK